MANIKEKIRRLRKTLKLTQEEFARQAKLSRGTIASYEAGNALPSLGAQRQIEEAFNVSPLYWSEESNEHMFDNREPTTNAELVDRLVSAYEDSYLMRDILLTWLNLTPAERAAAEGIVEKFLRVAHGDAQDEGPEIIGETAEDHEHQPKDG